MDVKNIKKAMEDYIYSFTSEAITCIINFKNHRNKKYLLSGMLLI